MHFAFLCGEELMVCENIIGKSLGKSLTRIFTPAMVFTVVVLRTPKKSCSKSKKSLYVAISSVAGILCSIPREWPKPKNPKFKDHFIKTSTVIFFLEKSIYRNAVVRSCHT